MTLKKQSKCTIKKFKKVQCGIVFVSVVFSPPPIQAVLSCCLFSRNRKYSRLKVGEVYMEKKWE